MKLYVVTISQRGYVLAASEKEAREAAPEVETYEPSEVDAKPATGHELSWEDDALVYGAAEDTTLVKARKITGLKP